MKKNEIRHIALDAIRLIEMAFHAIASSVDSVDDTISKEEALGICRTSAVNGRAALNVLKRELKNGNV